MLIAMAATASALARDETVATRRESRVSATRPAQGASSTMGKVEISRNPVTGHAPCRLSPRLVWMCSMMETTTAP